jgi:hypothetical protein
MYRHIQLNFRMSKLVNVRLTNLRLDTRGETKCPFAASRWARPKLCHYYRAIFFQNGSEYYDSVAAGFHVGYVSHSPGAIRNVWKNDFRQPLQLHHAIDVIRMN